MVWGNFGFCPQSHRLLKLLLEQRELALYALTNPLCCSVAKWHHRMFMKIMLGEFASLSFEMSKRAVIACERMFYPMDLVRITSTI